MQQKEKRKKLSKKIAKDLSDLTIYCRAAHFKSFEDSKQNGKANEVRISFIKKRKEKDTNVIVFFIRCRLLEKKNQKNLLQLLKMNILVTLKNNLQEFILQVQGLTLQIMNPNLIGMLVVKWLL